MYDDDFQGFRCICGEYVVAMHQECRALLTWEEFQKFNRGV